jgi:hypothetical protein
MSALEDTSIKEKEEQHEASLETPRVLTRNLIPTLTEGLDASDLLECYALVRSAPLHGIANSTISIQKMVLGIRFRPKAGDIELHVKEPMELTLEYGPQRVGSRLNDEATPIVQVEDSTSYLTWDNAGKVYFTRKLVKENFLSSYYMASITGAVLDELLTAAVEYSEQRKVYQPFAVYSEAKGRQLRSSSSSDFTWFIWSHLAKLGVEVDPILPPPVYELRLWVKSMKKVIPEPAVAHEAADFYRKLYNCLEAIATKNYGTYVAPASKTGSTLQSVVPSEVPSWEPSPHIGTPNGPTPVPSRVPGQANGDKNRKTGSENSVGVDKDDKSAHHDGSRRMVRRRLEEDEKYDDAFDDFDNGDDADEQSQPSSIESPSSQTGPNLQPGNDASHEGEVKLTNSTQSLSPGPNNNDTWTNSTSSFPSQQPTTTQEHIEGTPVQEQQTPEKEDPGQGVEKTKQAADEAQKAADQAKIVAETEGDTKAADAAQAAANAAQAAATATSEAAAQAAMDSLLSRDGAMVSSIVTTCLTNTRFDIASIDQNGTISTDAYLYRDSSFYYKLELASPYLEVAKLNRQMPKATVLSQYGSGGDTVDWILALSVVFAVGFMVLLICQQMGYHFIETIFRCQRWFFNPRKYDYEGDLVISGDSGPLFYFGQDGIPLSMGGRISSYSPIHQRETLDQMLENNTIANEKYGLQVPHLKSPSESSWQEPVELEMTRVTPSKSATHLRLRKHSSDSFGSTEEAAISPDSALPLPERLLRNPDLVDMPDLKSRSKVAVPVGSSQLSFSERQKSSSFGEGISDTSYADTTMI